MLCPLTSSKYRMLGIGLLFTINCFLLAPTAKSAESEIPTSFEKRLHKPISIFDARRGSFVQNLLGIVYRFQLPLALEYVDPRAVTEPSGMVLRDVTARQAIEALVQRLPEYRVSFSNGLVDIYSPKARTDNSNLLNVTIPCLEVSRMDASMASEMVFDALATATGFRGPIFHSVAGAGGKQVTISVRQMKVYEILNKIVSMQGKSVWVVSVPPNKLSRLQGNLWHLYSLDPSSESIIAVRLRDLFPASTRTGKLPGASSKFLGEIYREHLGCDFPHSLVRITPPTAHGSTSCVDTRARAASSHIFRPDTEAPLGFL